MVNLITTRNSFDPFLNLLYFKVFLLLMVKDYLIFLCKLVWISVILKGHSRHMVGVYHIFNLYKHILHDLNSIVIHLYFKKLVHFGMCRNQLKYLVIILLIFVNFNLLIIIIMIIIIIILNFIIIVNYFKRMLFSSI